MRFTFSLISLLPTVLAMPTQAPYHALEPRQADLLASLESNVRSAQEQFQKTGNTLKTSWALFTPFAGQAAEGMQQAQQEFDATFLAMMAALQKPGDGFQQAQSSFSDKEQELTDLFG